MVIGHGDQEKHTTRMECDCCMSIIGIAKTICGQDCIVNTFQMSSVHLSYRDFPLKIGLCCSMKYNDDEKMKLGMY